MAAIQKPGLGPFGPLVVTAACSVGFLFGGLLDHWMTGSGRSFGAFGAAFGLTIGGLIGAALVEFLLPMLLAVAALNTTDPAPPAMPGARAAQPTGPERISLAGRLLQFAAALLALMAGAVLFSWGIEPLAGVLAVTHGVAGAVLAGLVLALVAVAALGGASVARHLDLTVQ